MCALAHTYTHTHKYTHTHTHTHTHIHSSPQVVEHGAEMNASDNAGLDVVARGVLSMRHQVRVCVHMRVFG
jgi:hypothetical protein